MNSILLQKTISLFSSISLLLQSFLPFTYIIPRAQALEPLKAEIVFDNLKNSFELKLNTKEKTEYILVYKTDKQIEAVQGESNTQLTDFQKTIYAGTCSSGGSCVAHTVIRGIVKLEVKSQNWITAIKFAITDGRLIVDSESTPLKLDLSEEENYWLNNGKNPMLLPLPTDSITPTVTLTPTVAQAEVSIEPAQPTNTLTPTAYVTPTPQQMEIVGSTPVTNILQTPKIDGHVDTLIIASLSCRVDSLNGCLATDKPDYPPTDVAVITGTGFSPNTKYILNITSSDPPAVNFQTTITTNSLGNFSVSYQLDGNYRPNYQVYLRDLNGGVVAVTTFTDGAPHLIITGSGTGNGTVTSADGFINCIITSGVLSGTCSHTYGGNFNTTLSTSVISGSVFSGWSGGCTGTGTCSASATGNNTFSVNANFSLSKVNTTTTIVSDLPDPSDVNQSYTVNISVSRVSGFNTPSGTVTISDGIDSCTTANIFGSGGTATGSCNLTSTTSGIKTLTATYGGDVNFNGSSGTTSHTVNAEVLPEISYGAFEGETGPAPGSGVWTTGDIKGYKEGDNINFRLNLTSTGAGTGHIFIGYTSDPLCRFFNNTVPTLVSSTGGFSSSVSSIVGQSGNDAIADFTITSSGVNSGVLYFTLKLTNNAASCASGSSQHVQIDHTTDIIKNSGAKALPIPAKDVTPVTDLSILKSAPSQRSINDSISYIINVTNNDSVTTAQNVVVTDTLPTGTTFVSGTWTKTPTGSGSCTHVG